jgi:hypothetical protein
MRRVRRIFLDISMPRLKMSRIQMCSKYHHGATATAADMAGPLELYISKVRDRGIVEGSEV